MPRANKPFQILKKINDNAYKVKLRGEYSINTTFNVSDLCLFDLCDDSRANSFEERGNGVILALTPRDPLEVSLDLVTRLKAKGLRVQLMNFFNIHGLRWTLKGY
jgi:hypothetical protein